MKKILALIGVIIGIVLIICAIYIFFQIYFVVSYIDGQCYDGFGVPYGTDNKPSSPYTIIGLAFVIIGGYIVNYTISLFAKHNKE